MASSKHHTWYLTRWNIDDDDDDDYDDIHYIHAMD
jgi:hypothetical protein